MHYTIFRSSFLYERPPSSKEYHSVLIINTNTNRALVIFRWGKKGSFGQMKVETFDNATTARQFVESKVREKVNKGYSRQRDDKVSAENGDHLKKLLGPQYWAQIGPKYLEFIAPGIDTAGSRERPNPEYEQGSDGKWHRKEVPPKLVPEVEPPVEDQVKRNPLWGMF